MSVVAATVPALFWAGGLARVPSAVRVPERRPLCAALGAFAVALTVDIPSAYVGLDRRLGVPNVADLVEHVLGIIGVFALLRTLIGLTSPRTHRRRSDWTQVAMLAVAVSASAALFFAANPSVETARFTDRYGRLPLIAAYWSITIAYFGVSLVELASLVIKHSRHTRRIALRLGLRIVGVGVALGVVYSAIKIVELVLDQGVSADRVGDLAHSLDPVVLSLGAAVIGAGLLLPAVETVWTEAAARVSDRIALVRLRRLWLDLTAGVPAVVLGDGPSLWADLCGADASFRLYRRAIEIRDVYLAARSFESTLQLPQEHIDLLLSTLAAADADRNTHPASGVVDRQDVRRELRSLLELARIWRPVQGGSFLTRRVIT